MKIYFAGSIRGGREDAALYLDIIRHLQTYGEVLTEHIGDVNLTTAGESDTYSDTYIHDRDIAWVLESDVVVAEVTTVSMGVGYEIGRAVEHHKNTLCLYRPSKEKKLSGMIRGCNDVTVREYQTLEDAKKSIDDYLENLV